MTVAVNEAKFEVPGGGCWELESTHFTRPATPFVAEAFPAGFARGFIEGTARYGVMLSHFEAKRVNGFMYTKARIFAAPADAKGPPPKPVFFLLTRLHPGIRKRLRDGADAFERKLWREDLKSWDEEIKPAAIKAHRAIQSIAPEKLDEAALARHLTDCREHMERMFYQHHKFTITCMVPVGDLLAHAQEWTGKPSGEILALLKGSSPISKGAAADELDALVAAIGADAEAGALLGSGASAQEILDGLAERPGAVGEAYRAYIDTVGYRSLSYDVSEPFALELPGVLVRSISAAVHGATRDRGGSAKSEAIAALREAVPEAHRASFDEKLGEARLINRLRDERGHYSDGWACGLARRALLEVGRRLAAKAVIDDPQLAVEASHDELQVLLRGEKGVTRDELQARREYRLANTTADAPPWLGAPPAAPPPADWLPEPGRRAARAAAAAISNLFDVVAKRDSAATVSGLPVSPGTYEGIARVIRSESEFGRLQEGDVLVTRATSPYFNVVLPLLGGIVTDRGGQLSHAAIVSREYGIPGVVGTEDATKKIPDGARVRVDGTRGEVFVLSK